MGIVEMEQEEHIAHIKLNRGVTNAIGPDLVSDLTDTLKEARKNPEVRGLVLQSTNDKFFSIGLEVPFLLELHKAELETFMEDYNELCVDLYSMPMPTAAAITGHAVAGGCILALCCDHRYIADGRKLMGLNELALGLPVPFPGDCILRHELGNRTARMIMETGELFTPEAAMMIGLVDEVLPLEEVRPTATRKTKAIGLHHPGAFELIKGNRVEPVVERVKDHHARKERRFCNLWFTEHSQAQLKKIVDKF